MARDIDLAHMAFALIHIHRLGVDGCANARIILAGDQRRARVRRIVAGWAASGIDRVINLGNGRFGVDPGYGLLREGRHRHPSPAQRVCEHGAIASGLGRRGDALGRIDPGLAQQPGGHVQIVQVVHLNQTVTAEGCLLDQLIAGDRPAMGQRHFRPDLASAGLEHQNGLIFGARRRGEPEETCWVDDLLCVDRDTPRRFVPEHVFDIVADIQIELRAT